LGRSLTPLLIMAILGLVVAGLWIFLGPGTIPDTIEARQASLPKRLVEKGLQAGQPLFVRIFKQSNELELWMENDGKWTLFANFPVCKWSGKLGPKLKQGDKQAPEGFYEVTLASLNPNSRWHLSFNLGYPNAYDRAHGRTGSFLMVHGGCSSAGCYAMTNPAVNDIYRLVEAALRGGQASVPVHIFPFRMNNDAMAAHAENSWFPFWQRLKPAYDRFETERKPPAIKIAGKQYVIGAPVTQALMN
jgi:murein L,D-transpeptidase YafK